MIGTVHSKFLEMVGRDNSLLPLRRSIRKMSLELLRISCPCLPFRCQCDSLNLSKFNMEIELQLATEFGSSLKKYRGQEQSMRNFWLDLVQHANQ